MSRAQRLLRLYEEMEVPQSRILMRIPATWEGLQAAKQLEAQGIACHAILVYRSAHIAHAYQHMSQDAQVRCLGSPLAGSAGPEYGAYDAASCRRRRLRRPGSASSSPTSAGLMTGTTSTQASSETLRSAV